MRDHVIRVGKNNTVDIQKFGDTVVITEKPNNIMKIAVVRDVKVPTRGTSKSAGLDFYVPNDFKEFTLGVCKDLLIPSGIIANIPEGYMLMAADKSGMASSATAKHMCGMQVKPDAQDTSIVVGAKICDEDYQGEIHIHIINCGLKNFIVKPGMKLVQFILVPIMYADIEVVDKNDLFQSATERGSGGFSSTGVK